MRQFVPALAFITSVLLACSSSGGGRAAGSGGSNATGGSAATGGASLTGGTGSAGSTVTGGKASTGGSSGSALGTGGTAGTVGTIDAATREGGSHGGITGNGGATGTADIAGAGGTAGTGGSSSVDAGRPDVVASGSARNPIIWADFPDPAVIRIDDTYYMSNTTMHMCPGVPIMKSKDLVNWEPVGYAYQRMEDNDGTTLQNGKNMYGKGSWASSLRYHNGMYYVVFSALNTGKTYIYKTPDLASNKWEGTSFAPLLYDPSLFFDDDGRVYIMSQADDIRLVELNADLSGLKTGGFDQIVIPHASNVSGTKFIVTAEGNHLHKINGKYYHFVIAWPDNDIRTQLVFRSDKITGPYEGRIFLHDQGVAEGCLIDSPEGNWYAMLFQDGGAVGRIPYLVPTIWQDGWPVADNGGKVPSTLKIPATNTPVPASVVSDEFDQAGSQLKLQWQWNHNPDDRYWSLTQRQGFLRLTTGRVDSSFTQVRNMLTQRTFGPTSSGTVAVDVGNMKDGDVAGLALLQSQYGIVGVKMTGNSKTIVMISAESGSPAELASIPLAQSTVYLKADCDYAKKADKAYFYYSLDGQSWTAIGKALQMSYSLDQFVGYRFALFNYATKSALLTSS